MKNKMMVLILVVFSVSMCACQIDVQSVQENIKKTREIKAYVRVVEDFLNDNLGRLEIDPTAVYLDEVFLEKIKKGHSENLWRYEYNISELKKHGIPLPADLPEKLPALADSEIVQKAIGDLKEKNIQILILQDMYYEEDRKLKSMSEDNDFYDVQELELMVARERYQISKDMYELAVKQLKTVGVKMPKDLPKTIELL